MAINKCYGCKNYNGRRGNKYVNCSLGIQAELSIGCNEFSSDKTAI